jgi:hypothetical protein
LILENQKIYSDDGRLLKSLCCPFGVRGAELQSAESRNPLCVSCNKNLINADYYTEHDLERILESDKTACVIINPLNPMFRRD